MGSERNTSHHQAGCQRQWTILVLLPTSVVSGLQMAHPRRQSYSAQIPAQNSDLSNGYLSTSSEIRPKNR